VQFGGVERGGGIKGVRGLERGGVWGFSLAGR
jgi:hypothetical protein